MPSGPLLVLAVRSSKFFFVQERIRHIGNWKNMQYAVSNKNDSFAFTFVNIWWQPRSNVGKETIEVICNWVRIVDFGITYDEIIW